LTDADIKLAQRAGADCRLIQFPGASHQIHRDQPDATLLAVREFAATLAPF
jgi:pimeloyl-ACP methyl ester carboxylesterase